MLRLIQSFILFLKLLCIFLFLQLSFDLVVVIVAAVVVVIIAVVFPNATKAQQDIQILIPN